ncbi:MAG TPA: hypothetical protein DCP02_05015 [Actinobacteria bacterium]|nr:hypothetical protein [Actinomycetota bacterium]
MGQNRRNRKINKKKTVQGIFYDRQLPCNHIIILTHMVAVYIVILDIFIKLIRGILYPGGGLFPLNSYIIIKICIISIPGSEFYIFY